MARAKARSEDDWAALLRLGEAEQQVKMSELYAHLAGLSEEPRYSRMLALAQAENALPDKELRLLTLLRLRTWLQLEPEVAQQVSATYDAVMKQMPGPQAMRRVAQAQALARGFSLAEQHQLSELVPTVFPSSDLGLEPFKPEEPGGRPELPRVLRGGRWPYSR